MAENKGEKSNVKIEFNSANAGLNQDNTLSQIKKGSLTYALNAVVESFDGDAINYQNEPGNKDCIQFPEGYVLVGKYFIPELNKQLYFLTNPDKGYSQIGYMENNDCDYKVLACSSCLNFDINHPIHKVVHKVTKLGTEIYWADNNGRRYLNIDDIPRPLKTGSSLCDPSYNDDGCEIDCEKIKVQPNFSIPIVSITNVLSGGDITAGTVQFAVQYSDAVGNPFTSFYSVTNPTPVADTDLVTVNYNYKTGKSIVVDVQNLDVTGKFQYFNLAVIKTVNNISTPELVGTYFIDRNNKQITYTGQNQTQIQLAIEDIFAKHVYYDNADYVSAVQDILVWSGLTATKRVNYQEIASKIDLKWQTHRVPAGTTYADEVLATNTRGYLRDEVYAFEIAFLLANGKETDGFHIPGREKNSTEITAHPVHKSDPDFIGTPDLSSGTSEYWKIYNTATVSGTSSSYGTESSYSGPYQYGEMAYWESSEEYPCNVDIWGDLAGEKIRHHKFPDNNISPIFESDAFPGEESLVMEDRAMFPIGIKIDANAVQKLINDSSLTQDEKDDIVGFKILRGNRGVNKSIVAKGMLRNVSKYTRENQDYFYPNYPYNDVGEDPFINSTNNAWSAISEPYIINIVEHNEPADAAIKTYTLVEFTDPNTNKTATKKYDGAVGIQTPNLCSLTTPIIQGNGLKNKVKWANNVWGPADGVVATVSPANYDVWRVRVDCSVVNPLNGQCIAYRAGFNIQWVDPVEGTKVEWIRGNSKSTYLWTMKGTTPKNISTGNASNNERLDLYSEVIADECSKAEPIVPGTIDESLHYRQIFNSPDTSFGQPFLGDILKLENVIYGGGKAHFTEVKENAKYRLLTAEAQEDALKASEELGAITSDFNAGAMFSAYQAYLEIYINGITRKNYGYSFNSIASYNYSYPIPNGEGIKQRNLDIKKYLIPAVQNVGETDVNINNYNRESSVYLRTLGTEDDTKTALPLPHLSKEFATTSMTENSRFTISSKGQCSRPSEDVDINVVSYYGSLKNEFINQWGQIYSYETIDTGYTYIFGKGSLSPETVFGGDTFIGKFAYKTKLPFFIDNRVGAPDDSDVFYDETGNIAYPKYWHSSRSILKTYSSESNRMDMYNMISYKAHNFDCPNSQELVPEDADPDTNPNRTFYDGYMYLFAYGIPSFYCESSYNLDLRQAYNHTEGEFWPHVSTGIPDEWLQENNVSILNDNTYTYNVTYSKQNKESATTHLPEDWSIDYKNISYPFRAIYSDVQVTDADNKVNNWLTYRANSYFDFPQNYGKLTALDGLANKAILARFENKSLLYNNLVTINTTDPKAAWVGNPYLFDAPPTDFADTDLGYIGSQHKFILKIPQGAVFVDAKRSQVFLVNGNQAVDLTAFGSGMKNWSRHHMAFEILEHFPNVNVDNNFNGVGIHGVYDPVYNRIILTKLDYVPLYDTISYDEESNKYYNTTDLKREVFLSDQEFFCNKSWTLSYNFNTKSWTSFHSYLPNWYVGENKYFYSGVNYCPNDFEVLVGKLSDTFTTTTTTTRAVQITTTTTTTVYIPDCLFTGSITYPECSVEATAIIIETPDVCTRPESLTQLKLIYGYTLVNPATDYDSRSSSAEACSNLGYYVYAAGGDENYTAKQLNAQVDSFEIGSVIYSEDGSTDCTYVPDGWYFTDESSTENTAYRIEDGVVVEESSCSSITTTTTTTVPEGTDYCYTGLYTNPDPMHPLGGTVTYTDVYGEVQSINNIWVGDTINITALDIITTIGVGTCIN